MLKIVGQAEGRETGMCLSLAKIQYSYSSVQSVTPRLSPFFPMPMKESFAAFVFLSTKPAKMQNDIAFPQNNSHNDGVRVNESS